MFEESPNLRYRTEMLQRIEEDFTRLEFPIFALAPPATGMVGEVGKLAGQPISYSLIFPLDGSPGCITVATSIVEVGGLSISSNDVGFQPGRLLSLGAGSSPYTVVVDGQGRAGSVSVTDYQWLVSLELGDRTVFITGEERPPHRLELVSVVEAATFIHEWRRFLRGTFEQ